MGGDVLFDVFEALFIPLVEEVDVNPIVILLRADLCDVTQCARHLGPA